MPVAARSVIFKGSTFSPPVSPALNLTRAREVALVGESGSAERDVNFASSNCESKNTECCRAEAKSSYCFNHGGADLSGYSLIRGAETKEIFANGSVFGQI